MCIIFDSTIHTTTTIHPLYNSLYNSLYNHSSSSLPLLFILFTTALYNRRDHPEGAGGFAGGVSGARDGACHQRPRYNGVPCREAHAGPSAVACVYKECPIAERYLY